ncbi:MAG: hypothetical protein ACREJO_01100 [Phycisphaerales bacterium]
MQTLLPSAVREQNFISDNRSPSRHEGILWHMGSLPKTDRFRQDLQTTFLVLVMLAAIGSGFAALSPQTAAWHWDVLLVASSTAAVVLIVRFIAEAASCRFLQINQDLESQAAPLIHAARRRQTSAQSNAALLSESERLRRNSHRTPIQRESDGQRRPGTH